MSALDIAGISGVVGAAVAGLGAYLFTEPFMIRVRELELSFPNLPPAFDGYTILHLSDLHITKHGLLEKKTMALISGRQVDVCFITGDVTVQPRASDTFRRVCSAIDHRDPIYMVLGNSEHKPWLNTEMLVDALSFEGLNMLINRSDVITCGGESIRVVGVDDAYSHFDDLDAAFKGVDPSEFTIFLTHSPSNAPSAIERGADLVLSGHTHGGQVRIPGLGMLYTHMHSNKALNDGLYMPADLNRLAGVDAGSSILFVNRGVGTSRIHIRFLCRPEIVYITLRRGHTANTTSFFR